MLLEDLLAKTDHFEDVEINATFPKVGARSLIVSGKRVASEGKETQMILLTIKDKRRLS